MGQDIRQILKRFNPDDWEEVQRVEEPIRGKRYKGCVSIEITLRNKATGQLIIRHRILDPATGKVRHDHFRLA